MIKRAYVGLSSPVGYFYGKYHDRESRIYYPPPILYGSMGLLVLYDEIWFVNESVCPPSMRSLDYVKFLERDAPKPIGLDKSILDDVKIFINNNNINQGWNLDDLIGENYSEGIRNYVGRSELFDNHSKGSNFFDIGVNGNPTIDNLTLDYWILDYYRELGLEIVLNPATVRAAIPLVYGDSASEDVANFSKIDLSESIISLRSLYDLVGSDGPYHPSIEEIRQDPLLITFRKWTKSRINSRLHNAEVREIQSEVENKITELTKKALLKNVSRDKLRNVAVDLVMGYTIKKCHYILYLRG